MLTLVRIMPFEPFEPITSKPFEKAVSSSRFKLFTGRLFIVNVAIPVLSLTSTSTKSFDEVD